jgi:zinc-ribbon family
VTTVIIFGTRTYLHQLAILTLICGNCGNPSAHALRKRVMKFTLFFVPLFPVSTRYSSQCTFCGVQHQVPKDQAEALLAQVSQGPASRQGRPGGQYGGGQHGPYGQQAGAPRQRNQNPYQN